MEMSKVLSFSQEQKSLIWNRFVQPNGGTQEEAKHFVEVCEIFGLNPLVGDIVFQKYETRQGPRTNFITTRDGLLRVAARQPDYIGAPVANVVREGDRFEFMPSEGSVKHEFGQKRGKILGAYAVLFHKRFRPVSVFVDFEEYFKANSSATNGGKPNTWDKMPSAMIQKVAEVFVLRRQFPLGGLYTREEMGVEDLNSSSQPQEIAQVQTTSYELKQEKQVTQFEKSEEDKRVSPPATPEPPKTQEVKQEGHFKANTSKAYVLTKYESGRSPSGIPFAKIHAIEQDSGKALLVFARGEEAVNTSKRIPKEGPFSMTVRKENGFDFLESVNVPEARVV